MAEQSFASPDGQRQVVSIDAGRADVLGAYRAARDRFEASGDIRHALAAGREWRRFLDTFITPEQKAALDSADKVLTFRRPA